MIQCAWKGHRKALCSGFFPSIFKLAGSMFYPLSYFTSPLEDNFNGSWERNNRADEMKILASSGKILDNGNKESYTSWVRGQETSSFSSEFHSSCMGGVGVCLQREKKCLACEGKQAYDFVWYPRKEDINREMEKAMRSSWTKKEQRMME